jgi:hypothetical protein
MLRQFNVRHISITFLLLTVIFVGDSCKKAGFGYVEGTVVDETGTLTIKNAKVTLYRSRHGNQEYPVKETTTDDNGKFKIKYYKNRFNYGFILGVQSDNCYVGYMSSYIETRKANYVINISLKAFVRLKIINNRPSSINLTARAYDDHFTTDLSQSVPANSTLISNDVLKIRVHHSTDIGFFAYESGVNITSAPVATVLMTTALDTLLYTVTIN